MLFGVIEAIEQVLADGLLDGVIDRSMEEVREQRTRCADIEADVSLARRVVQGRLDIVGHEARRRGGDTAAADALPGLLFDLPSLMTDEARGGASGTPGARHVSINAPGEAAAQLVDRLDAIASPGTLTGIGGISDSELGELLERMRGFENELSQVRRSLHDRIDALQAEIGRRYRDGEASIDQWLR